MVGKLRDFACDSRIDELFSADDLTRWTTKRQQRFDLEFSTDRGAFLYELVIEHQPDDRGVEVKNESLAHDDKPVLSSCDRKLQLYRDDGSKGHVYPFGRNRSALATESDTHLYSRLHRFRSILSSLQMQPWLAELEDGAGDTLPQVVLISHHPEAIDFLAHNTVWPAREPESHTRIIEPKNDTGLRMSEVHARGWTP